MAIRTELNLRLPNRPGALNEVCRALADKRDVLVTPLPNTPGGLAPVLAPAPRCLPASESRHPRR